MVGITPTGFISFHCSSYGVGASGTLISRESRFYDLLERDDEVTAERGFQIQKDLFLNFCRLVVPSSARVKSQMTKSEVKKTKEVPNLRILVERAVNRTRFFRILKGTILLKMMQHVHDMILTCAALCNLKSELIKTKEKDLQK